MIGEGKTYLKPSEAANFLDVSRSLIFKWRREGVLPNQEAWTRDELHAAEQKAAKKKAKRANYVPPSKEDEEFLEGNF